MPKCGVCGYDSGTKGVNAYCEVCGSELLCDRRYYALRAIQAGYRIMAWIVLIAVPVFVIVGGQQLRSYFPQGMSNAGAELVVGVIVGIIGWLAFMSLAEGISVIIDIEQNTRSATKIIAELARNGSSRGDAPGTKYLDSAEEKQMPLGDPQVKQAENSGPLTCANCGKTLPADTQWCPNCNPE